MSKQTLDIDTGIALLRELALDLRWSWNHAADSLWSKLDAALWERTRNPWVMLQSASRKRLAQLLASSEFRDMFRQLAVTKRQSAPSHVGVNVPLEAPQLLWQR